MKKTVCLILLLTALAGLLTGCGVGASVSAPETPQPAADAPAPTAPVTPEPTPVAPPTPDEGLLYARAIALFEAGDDRGAEVLFTEIPGYADADFYLRRIALRRCEPGDTLLFGSYASSEDGAEAPISWTVLEREEGRLLLLSDRGLEPIAYAPSLYPFWANSPVRDWLNGDFLSAAFTAEELALIAQTQVVTPDYVSSLGVYLGGPDSTDRVFLLSLAEIERYFPEEAARLCPASPWAAACGARVDAEGNCSWWSRSPGDHHGQVSLVLVNGVLSAYAFAGDTQVCVRPALWLEP